MQEAAADTSHLQFSKDNMSGADMPIENEVIEERSEHDEDEQRKTQTENFINAQN